MDKIIIFLLYLSILLFLSLPKLDIGLIEIGSINIYIFEIPLAISLIFSIFYFLVEKLTFNKKESAVGRIYLYSYGPLLIIGVIGSFSSQENISTILSSLRPIIYWLTGLIVILIGQNNIKLKSLFWIVILGLLLQFITGTIYTILFNDTSLEGRFAGRSGFMVLIAISALLIAAMGRKRLGLSIENREYFILKSSTMILLIFILLIQNRTVWIAVFFLISYFAFKEKNSMLISKIIIMAVILLISLGILSTIGLIPSNVLSNLENRLLKDTLSTEGAELAMLSRSLQYEAAYQNFVASPIFGHGFGHILNFVNVWDPDIFTRSSGMDNSYINIVHKFGIVGLVMFVFFLYKIFFTIKRGMKSVKKKDLLYLLAFFNSFPLFCLISLNIDVFYTYPEVIITSLFSAKGLCITVPD